MAKVTLPSTAVGRRRLLKLAGMLDEDAKKETGIKFDLGLWGCVLDAGLEDVPEEISVNCGTAACAVGLACISGKFKRAGLTYRAQSKDSLGGNNFQPVFGLDEGFDAVKNFFAISYREAEHLFSYTAYPDTRGAAAERAVAKRIRSFVAGRAAPR